MTLAQLSTDILDAYEILSRMQSTEQGKVMLGRNGCGEVVIKLYNDSVGDWDAIDKANEGGGREVAFLKRAAKDGRIDVANLVQYGFTERMGFQEPVAVLERIQGRTLREVISEGGFNGTLEGAIRLAKNVGSTLNYAHKEAGTQPFYHRDVKPENIMIREDGSTVLLDWACGRIGSGNTLVNTMVCSLGYTAPEVIRGGTVTAASDVYSLAKVLQNYLLGKEFDVVTGEVTRKQMEMLNIPSNVIDSLEKATQEQPEKRYQMVDDFLEALERRTIEVAEDRRMTVKNPILSKTFDKEHYFYARCSDIDEHLFSPIGVVSIAGTVAGHQCSIFHAGVNVASEVGGGQGYLFGIALNMCGKVGADQSIWAGVGANIAGKVGEYQYAGLLGVNMAKEVGEDQSALFAATNIAKNVGGCQKAGLAAINIAGKVDDAQYAYLGSAINIADEIEGGQAGTIGFALNVARKVKRNQVVGIGVAINIAGEVGEKQYAFTGCAVNIARRVGDSQYGLVNVVTEKLGKRQVGIINYAGGDDYRQYGLLNFRPGKRWWNPEVSLFYHHKKGE